VSTVGTNEAFIYTIFFIKGIRTSAKRSLNVENITLAKALVFIKVAEGHGF
jgi:hypothetical protein